MSSGYQTHFDTRTIALLNRIASKRRGLGHGGHGGHAGGTTHLSAAQVQPRQSSSKPRTATTTSPASGPR